MEIYSHKLGGAIAGFAPDVERLTTVFSESGYLSYNIITCSAFEMMTRNIDAIVDIITSDELSAASKLKHCEYPILQFEKTHKTFIRQLFNDKDWAEKAKQEISLIVSEIRAITQSLVNGINHNSIYGHDDSIHSYFHSCMLKFGELASTKTLSHYLSFRGIDHKYIDSRTFIKTRFRKVSNESFNNHNDVDVDFKESEALTRKFFFEIFKTKRVIIYPGFISQDFDTGEDTTLNYDGSDYSSALTAFFCNSRVLNLWKDVEGVYTSDPKNNPDAKIIHDLTYHEYFCLCEKNGTWPIRRDAIELCAQKGIVVFLRPANDPKSKGTRIH